MGEVGRIAEAWSDASRKAASEARRAKGDCYPSAYGLATSGGKGLTLCHGTVIGQGHLDGQAFSHAWVERDDKPVATVLDNSNGNKIEMPAPAYHAIGRITDVHRYTPMEAMTHARKSGHYGPWEGRWA